MEEDIDAEENAIIDIEHVSEDEQIVWVPDTSPSPSIEDLEYYLANGDRSEHLDNDESFSDDNSDHGSSTVCDSDYVLDPTANDLPDHAESSSKRAKENTKDSKNMPNNSLVPNIRRTNFWRSRQHCAKLGSYITEEYGLLRKVFSYLPLINLNSAGLVCRKWAVASRAEKQSRLQPYWFIFKQVTQMSHWNKFKYGIYSPSSLCFWFSNQEFDQQYQYHLLKPDTGVCDLMQSIKTIVRSMHCSFIPVKTHGIVGTTTDLKITREGPTYDDDYYIAACVLFLPLVPGVEVHTFKLDTRDCRRMRHGNINDDWIKKTIGGPNKPIKCLLLFCKNIPLAPSLLVHHLQKRQEAKIALGGAIIQNVELDDKDEYFVGVMFYGDKLVASSMVLNQIIEKKEDIEAKMKEFREGSIDGQHNIGLMFSCVGRSIVENRQMERDNVESQLFRKYFPGRPLQGVIGHGEIGWDHLPGKILKTKAKKTKLDPWPKILHSYSTVFVHLGFNYKNE